MKLIIYSCFGLLALLISCSYNVNNRKASGNIEDTMANAYWRSVKKTIPKDLMPVFGYRFIIKGDFDGDGVQETLTEHFYSSTDKKESFKFYDSLSYDQLIVINAEKKPLSFLTCSNANVDTLHIASGPQFGLCYLKNEGDLNLDGRDEISYVIDWADFSSLNTCHLMSYNGIQWQELYSFGIWEWQIPSLPQGISQYGLFGLEDKIINTDNDTLNLILEKELLEFPGFIKKVKQGLIKVVVRTDEAEIDTIFVDLKKVRNKKN